MLLELKNSVTYGPVDSRRLGRSLGINLFPGRRKVCTFDCLYCQYGRAEPVGGPLTDRRGLPSVQEVVRGLEEALLRLPEPPAYLTFSGNGEPTLHPDFPAVVARLMELRDRLAPQARTAVLSNSTTVGVAEVRRALARLDVRIMKLDAGDEPTLRGYNGAAPGLSLGGVLEGLRTLGRVTLQSLFAAGPGGNLAPAHVEKWLGAVASINPSGVQLYTLDREAPSRQLRPAGSSELERIRVRFAGMGVRAEVFSPARPPSGRNPTGSEGH